FKGRTTDMDHIRRDQTPQFSQPLSQILTMLAIVGGIVGLGYLAYPSVGPTFWANPYLNAFILFVGAGKNSQEGFTRRITSVTTVSKQRKTEQ
ncbi:hypothetical protein N9D24_00800, partial [bacterium]|nr:hypothetical protein [bacterium]